MSFEDEPEVYASPARPVIDLTADTEPSIEDSSQDPFSGFTIQRAPSRLLDGSPTASSSTHLASSLSARVSASQDSPLRHRVVRAEAPRVSGDEVDAEEE
jgi:hypothetical protein